MGCSYRLGGCRGESSAASRLGTWTGLLLTSDATIQIRAVTKKLERETVRQLRSVGGRVGVAIHSNPVAQVRAALGTACSLGRPPARNPMRLHCSSRFHRRVRRRAGAAVLVVAGLPLGLSLATTRGPRDHRGPARPRQRRGRHSHPPRRAAVRDRGLHDPKPEGSSRWTFSPIPAPQPARPDNHRLTFATRRYRPSKRSTFAASQFFFRPPLECFACGERGY